MLFESIKTATEGKETVFIAGDFILPDIKWPLIKLDGYNTLHDKFVELIAKSSLHQLVTDITRKRNEQETLLDLILCNDENLCTKIEHQANIGKSDHEVLLATLQVLRDHRPTSDVIYPRKNFYKANYNLISETLRNEPPMPTMYNIKNVWGHFKNKIHKIINLHVPVRRLKGAYNSNKPWIGSDILKLTQRKSVLWRNYIIERSEVAYKSINE
ncbi:unnamed protein product [Euphydryas editha]|uniref:Endonuclease/exonuclease/phosphatase domain-containing protein n=1 Tax=Euphydryas editha TaxID=104508 RepID=A0AAU9VF08_EUPED|nr:unnamed protein product [Euphydryas editha]